MKVKSADNAVVRYPLKKELMPILVGIGLSVSEHAASFPGNNNTEMEISKIAMGQQPGAYDRRGQREK